MTVGGITLNGHQRNCVGNVVGIFLLLSNAKMLKTAECGEQYCACKTGHDRINHHRDGISWYYRCEWVLPRLRVTRANGTVYAKRRWSRASRVLLRPVEAAVIFTVLTSPDVPRATMWGHMPDTLKARDYTFSRPKLAAEVDNEDGTVNDHNEARSTFTERRG